MVLEDKLISLILSRYRQDSGYPQTPSSNTNGFGGGISVYTKPLDSSGVFSSVNPAVIQNQVTNPRESSVSTDASINTYPTFDTKTFVIFLVIVGAIWFFGRG